LWSRYGAKELAPIIDDLGAGGSSLAASCT
jgi:hypothetical protein